MSDTHQNSATHQTDLSATSQIIHDKAFRRAKRSTRKRLQHIFTAGVAGGSLGLLLTGSLWTAGVSALTTSILSFLVVFWIKYQQHHRRIRNQW